MLTKTIFNWVNRSLRSGHLVIGPVLFLAVSSRKRPAQALRWFSITKKCSGILLTRFNGCASEDKVNNSPIYNQHQLSRGYRQHPSILSPLKQCLCALHRGSFQNSQTNVAVDRVFVKFDGASECGPNLNLN